MIRIDEIYPNYWWAWFARHRPNYRVFYCDPFGRSDPDSIIGHAREEEGLDTNYVLFFDQEPVHAELHAATFDQIRYYNNQDIHDPTWHATRRGCEQPAQLGHVVTSEYASESVAALCARMGWQQHYYWFHGWAALDWYRGYDRAELIQPPELRRIEQAFVAPMRIVGGLRQHRLHVLYWIFRAGLEQNNWVSCPAVCPAEMTPMADLIEPLSDTYPDIVTVFDRVTLPLNMPGESGHPMTSCWLDLWSQVETSMVYVVTETVADGARQHLTEKIFKPICQQIPFVVVGTAGALAYLRSYGFRTFGDLWDESYDDEPDMTRRIEQIGQLLAQFDQLTQQQRQELYERALPVVRHNYEHFYSGSFERVLWQELQQVREEF